MVPRVRRPFTLHIFNDSENSRTAFICIFSFRMTYQSYIFILRIAFSGQSESLGCLVYSSIHDSIMPSKKLTSKLAPNARQVNSLKEACLNSSSSKLSDPIDKNAIIAEYNVSCQKQGIKDIVSPPKKVSQLSYPSSIHPSPNSSVAAR